MVFGAKSWQEESQSSQAAKLKIKLLSSGGDRGLSFRLGYPMGRGRVGLLASFLEAFSF